MISTESENSLVWVKRQKVLYKFPINLETVWNFVKDVRATYETMKDVRTDAKFVKGKESYEKGAEFEMTWRKHMKVKLIVADVVDRKNFKQLHYKVNLEAFQICYTHVYSFYNITVDQSTLVRQDLIYDGEKGIRIVKAEADLLQKDSKNMFERFDKHLTAPIENLNQFESLDMPCSSKTLWKIITDWSLFRKIAPQICDECAYKGDPEKVGTILMIKWTEIKKATCFLKVIKANFNLSEGRHEYFLYCFESEPRIPLQELRFTLIELDEKLTLLHFEHQYLEPLDSRITCNISKFKKSVLKHLKKAIVFIAKKGDNKSKNRSKSASDKCKMNQIEEEDEQEEEDSDNERTKGKRYTK